MERRKTPMEIKMTEVVDQRRRKHKYQIHKVIPRQGRDAVPTKKRKKITQLDCKTHVEWIEKVFFTCGEPIIDRQGNKIEKSIFKELQLVPGPEPRTERKENE